MVYIMNVNNSLSMFKYADNEQGFIQCTIKGIYRSDFFELGFVDSVDLIKKPSSKKPKKKERDLLSED